MTKIRRRDLVRVAAATGVAAAAGVAAIAASRPPSRIRNPPGKTSAVLSTGPIPPKFRPSTASTATRRSERCMLIRRPDRQPRPEPELATAESQGAAAVDRRTFLRRSGLLAGGLAGLGLLPAGTVRKTAAGTPPPQGVQVTRRKNICTHCSVGCSVIAEVANNVGRPRAGLR
jgi:anaerobic selenocysteine-containing dehydrogenase